MRRDVFQALADPTRREILELLVQKTLNLNAVSENFDISRPAISRHIKILRECGLVAIHRKGRERYCEARQGRMKEVQDWVAYYRSFWTVKLDALEKHLEKTTKRKKKNTGIEKTNSKK